MPTTIDCLANFPSIRPRLAALAAAAEPGVKREQSQEPGDGKRMKREYDFARGKRGPAIRMPAGKTRITIRLDDDIIDWFRDRVNAAVGGNYQTMMNDALRQFMMSERQPLEASLRRVVREELAAYERKAGSKQRRR